MLPRPTSPFSDSENALAATSGMSVSRAHKSQMSLLTIFATDGGTQKGYERERERLLPLQQLWKKYMYTTYRDSVFATNGGDESEGKGA